MGARNAALAALLVGALAPASLAQSPTGPVEGGAIEQSCRALNPGGTAGMPDQAPGETGGEFPTGWPAGPDGLLPRRVALRSRTETYNRLYEFATRRGEIYGRTRGGSEPWRSLPLPLCFAGRVAAISLDDDEMIALDRANRIFTMDNALKSPALFNWTSRWGNPTWLGPGFALPSDLGKWSWSVISPLEDGTWTDPAGNRTAIGAGKVSHIWALRPGGQRLTFFDPWLPLDESYEMCGPHRGRFRSAGLSVSGSYVFVVGRRGDLFTRFYDFDIAGHNSVFFSYSYEDQRGRGDGSPIQLPGARWVEQPKIPGQITSAISIHKVRTGAIHRILRVEGRRGGRTGYWERDVAAPRSARWKFHATGGRLKGRLLRNPRRDTSVRRLGTSENRRYRMRAPGIRATLRNFNPYCSPARLRVREGGTIRRLRLHTVDGLRQQPRARGLDATPREQYGAIEGPRGTFQEVTVQATRKRVAIEELGWSFEAVKRRRQSR